MANYTCVAENIAGKRLSDPVSLTVYGKLFFICVCSSFESIRCGIWKHYCLYDWCNRSKEEETVIHSKKTFNFFLVLCNFWLSHHRSDLMLVHRVCALYVPATDESAWSFICMFIRQIISVYLTVKAQLYAILELLWAKNSFLWFNRRICFFLNSLFAFVHFTK